MKPNAVLLVIILVGVALAASAILLAQEQSKIKIGVIMPLTGKSAVWGQSVKEAVELAAEGRDVRLIFEDSECDPKKSVSAVTKLVDVDRVSAIIGGFCSSETLSMAPVTEAKKTVLVTPASSASAVSGSGDYIFRHSASNDQAAKMLAEKVSADGHENVAVLYILNDYGKDYSDGFAKYFQGRIEVSEGYDTSTTDFRTPLLKIKNSNATALLLFINLEGSTLLKQFSEMGIDLQLYGSTTWNSRPNLAGVENETEGLVYPLTDVSMTNPKYAKFEGLFRARYNRTPSTPWVAANAYDTFNILYENIGPGLKEKLYTIVYEGASGTVDFDENGDAFNSLRLVTVHNGTAK